MLTLRIEAVACNAVEPIIKTGQKAPTWDRIWPSSDPLQKQTIESQKRE